jgi:hypothetical protein
MWGSARKAGYTVAKATKAMADDILTVSLVALLMAKRRISGIPVAPESSSGNRESS